MIPIGEPRDIGETIALLRTLQRLTQRGLAAASGVRQSQVALYEVGGAIPGLANTIALLAALGHGLAIVPADESGPETALSATESAEQASGVDGEGLGGFGAVETRLGGEARTWECKLTRQHNPATEPCDCRVSQFCAMGRSLDEPKPRFWGEHPAHPTCIDVTGIDQMPGSEWACGPECPKEA